MSSQKMNFLLPVGRVVAGSPSFMQSEYKGQKKDKPTWFFAVAVLKTDPAIASVLQQIMDFAWQGYAHFPQVQQQMQRGLASDKFARKIEDGDAQENAQKEGWAGCWVFKFSTTLGAPPCYDANNMPIDPTHVKTGYFVSVYCGIAVNEQRDHTAGIYMNPVGVQLVGYGPEIRSGPSADQMFGAAGARQLPPGASATPVAPSGSPAPGQYPPQQQQHQAAPPPQQGGFGVPQQQAPQYQQAPQPGFAAPTAAAPGAQPQMQPTAASHSNPGFAQNPPHQAGGYPAGAQGAPVPQQGAPAGWAGQPQQGATAYPSNPYPGGQQVTPHVGFGQPQ